MRVEIKTVDGDTFEGSIASKDESFVFVRQDGEDKVWVIHWSHIEEGGVRRVVKGKKLPVNMDLFRKTRE